MDAPTINHLMTNSRPSDWPALPAMLEQNASHFGARAALLSDGDEPLSHQQLRNQVAETVTVLNSLGVGRGGRVAIVLPQGPALAVPSRVPWVFSLPTVPAMMSW